MPIQDYANQTDGVNAFGTPYINGQTAENAVQDLSAVLAALGYSSMEELMAAAEVSNA